ncbi:hypothetical protein F9C07_2284781 [Aspergillus flavus]|uniref:Uncharacterized protein n=1 Tax=Aspergillus flavus (strain ATCC 200026 / FGSC A1120 / IAM 13836 / NRRL 3357 / JCM 12722 / SRRC 167) TaxID=332952 RepID=A0A7U2MI03_ASPFN|nr:hypothetical protein F9C07_2284781 [Aspergillus flavus]
MWVTSRKQVSGGNVFFLVCNRDWELACHTNQRTMHANNGNRLWLPDIGNISFL